MPARRLTRPAVHAALLAAALAVGGCETLGLSGGDDNDRDRPIASSSDTEGRRVASGSGVQSYKAREDGTVRLYNADRDELIYQGRLREGQTFRVDPGKDLATVDGEKVFDQNLERDDRHTITFVAQGSDRRDDRRADRRDTSDRGGKPTGVPDEASSLATVSGSKPYTYRPARDGVAYVVDTRNDKLVARQNVGKGENLTIHLAKDSDRLSVDGKAVKIPLDRNGSYCVFWQNYQAK